MCLSFYFRVPGYPTVTGIGYPVPKISVNEWNGHMMRMKEEHIVIIKNAI